MQSEPAHHLEHKALTSCRFNARCRYQLPITTGTRLEVYGFEIGPEEPLETPIGTVRALPIRQLQRSGLESIEIWLAAEYRYLPVRIRH